jgi:transcriptional antiterminator RfaH
MTEPEALNWYVVHTHAHAEAKAATHLAWQGFSVYLPRYRKHRRHARRVEVVAAPLFPRYLFVALNCMKQGWRSVSSTIGVSHLICNGERPVMVPHLIIDEIRAREDGSGTVRLNEHAQFAPGDKVRISGGAFSDCLGLFECMNDRERVTILLDLLGRKVRVLMSGDCVVPI